MKTKRLSVAVLLSVLLILVSPSLCAVEPDDAAGAREAVARGNNGFALDLYARLRGRQGNLFFSPFSIRTALAMTWAGARGNTAEQMEATLRFQDDQAALHGVMAALQRDLNQPPEKNAWELSVANALWGQEGFRFLDEFLGLLKRNYGAGLRQVDFARATEKARQTINRWIEKETRDKIKDLIKPGVLNADTRLVLTNAIYFKGTWQHQFKKRATADQPFTLQNGDEVRAPMMTQTERFRYFETPALQALEMTYRGNRLSMIVLLPRKKDGLPDLEKALDAKSPRGWIAGLKSRRVEVSLPKFTTTSEFGLADTLKAMGMADAFAPMKADFSDMTGKRDLFISAVIHKAFVDVNEEGTEAAAATGVVMAVEAEPERPVIFRADHPFLFLIRDRRSGSILFMGRIMDPR